jgi:hypothetical protein
MLENMGRKTEYREGAATRKNIEEIMTALFRVPKDAIT